MHAPLTVMGTGAADIILALDAAEYIPKKLPPSLKGIVFKMIRQNLGAGWQMLQAIRNPTECKQRHLAAERGLQQALDDVAANDRQLSLQEFAESTLDLSSTRPGITLWESTASAALWRRTDRWWR